jgi:hypothetical protein
MLAYCGQKDVALRAIASAIDKGYCAYEGLQHDPLLAKARGRSEFAQLLSTGKTCQNDFLSKRAKPTP